MGGNAASRPGSVAAGPLEGATEKGLDAVTTGAVTKGLGIAIPLKAVGGAPVAGENCPAPPACSPGGFASGVIAIVKGEG